MAGDVVAPGTADDGAERVPEALVGVRMPGSSRVAYYATTDLELDVGAWVIVPAAAGPAIARVVIAPRQVAHTDLDVPRSFVVRRARREEVVDVELVGPGDPAARGPANPAGPDDRRIGGLGMAGWAGDSGMSPAEAAAAARLPALGALVRTPSGQGIVVARDVERERVRVRIGDQGIEEFPVANLRVDGAPQAE